MKITDEALQVLRDLLERHPGKAVRIRHEGHG
jgi:hypothetical protein